MKTSKSYYLCQFFGSLLFFTFIFSMGMTGKEEKPDLTYELIKSLKVICVFFIATHFIIRRYLKSHLTNTNSSFKTYLIAITFAILFSTLANGLWGIAFGDPTKDYLSFSYIFKQFVGGAVTFSIWCLLYLAVTSIRERIKLKRQLKDHELASLMNQINPHFLFNSLNTIRGMIYEDKDKSAELVTKLSTLFRYNLSTDTKAHTSLAGELEVCQHYLAIEDIRLGKRLTVKFDISPESENAKIPTMGILTLVENSIKHGISNLQQGGTLLLNSRIENDLLLIQVSNPYRKDLVNSGTQVGLKNLTQRIALIFGEQGKLSQHNTEDTFIVNLSLPYQVV